MLWRMRYEGKSSAIFPPEKWEYGQTGRSGDLDIWQSIFDFSPLVYFYVFRISLVLIRVNTVGLVGRISACSNLTNGKEKIRVVIYIASKALSEKLSIFQHTNRKNL